MTNNEILARIANDTDVQDTLVAALQNDGKLGVSEADELECGSDAFSRMADLGLAEEMRLDWTLRLNRKGLRVAQDLREDLEHGRLREQALERAILKAVRGLSGERVDLSQELNRLEAPRHGQPWSKAEVDATVPEMEKEGLIEGLGNWGGYLVTGITSRGRARLSPFATAAAASSSTVHNRNMNIGTNYGNVASGDHSRQTSTIHVNEAALGALKFAAPHVDDLPEGARESASKAVGEACQALEQQEPETATSALEGFIEGANDIAGSPTLGNFLALLSVIVSVIAV